MSGNVTSLFRNQKTHATGDIPVGGLIAAVSLFALLQRGLGGQSLDQTLPLIIALLGGLLLYQVNWGVALALGMIGTAAVVVQFWKGPKGQ